MVESRELDSEFRKVTTNMNVPSVDEDLHVRSFRNRDISYNTRSSTIDNQNSKTKQMYKKYRITLHSLIYC